MKKFTLGKRILGERGGFTLLEMLLVIAIIAILAGIVIVAINPARQIAAANNAQRQSDILAILNAVHQYGIDEGGVLTGLSLPQVEDAASVCASQGDLICVGDTATGCANTEIYTELVASGTYISAVPQDPKIDSATNSGYRIIQDNSNSRITVCAPQAENGETISVTR